MVTLAGDGPKKRSGAREGHTVAILLRSFRAAWPEIDQLLLPGARPEIVRLIRQVSAYEQAERRMARSAIRNRERRRAQGKRVAEAITAWFRASQVLRSSWRAALLAGLDLEPETARACRTELARFEAEFGGYLFRYRGRALGMAAHKERTGPRRDYLFDTVVLRLVRIVETYRRDPNGALLTHVGRARDEPAGVLFKVVRALQDCLPCLRRQSDVALYQALVRTRGRLRRGNRFSRPQGINLST